MTISLMYDYFIDVSWDKRYYDEFAREEWYLKIVPSKKMRYSIFTENKEYSWSLIYSKFYNDYRWKNSQSLKEQYFCHISKAFFKSSWNLEPFRISSNIVCN